ncbi:hypothetical protein Btru_054964 [Bulinus truncatus]|nr:hypothetical protein Btru_054964 [Bulinus truncatus]
MYSLLSDNVTSGCIWYRGWLSLTPRRFKSCKCFISTIVLIHVCIIVFLLDRKYLSSVNTLLIDNIQSGDSDQKTENEVKLLKPNVHLFQSNTRHSKRENSKTACSYRTTSYLNDKAIVLDQEPFLDYTKQMVCLDNGNIAAFADRFVLFNNVVIDPSKSNNAKKGGEKMEEVWDQTEQDEYMNLQPGYFGLPCTQLPRLSFESPDHLVQWKNALVCYKLNETDMFKLDQVSGLTLAIQRYEYVNLYHTMTDFYNAFVLMLIFGQSSSKVNILFIDAHPAGTLDVVWSTLFHSYIRAGRFQRPTVFSTLAWGMLGYFSPLNRHELTHVPYLKEFREFFLSKHNISSSHVVNCQKLNVVLIWRRDYVAHPRNKQGNVVRKFDNEEEMVDQVKKTLGESSDVTGIQLDSMSITSQLKAISKCDILIGMHGAGLSHILFLPASSGIIEFKPSYSNPSLQHFEAMARWRQIPYSIWINSDPANEKPSYRTYIPRIVLHSEVQSMYNKICPKPVQTPA